MDARLVGDLSLDQRRAHVGRRHRVHGDVGTARRRLQRHRLGQADDAVLGRDVRRLVRRRHQAVHRGDVDDPPPAALVHRGQQAADQHERRGQHHLEQQRPPLLVELLDGADVLEAGVVDEDVHISDLVGEAVDVVAHAEVGGHGDAAVHRLGGDVEALTGKVAEHDAGAPGAEVASHGEADARGGAGDQGATALDRRRAAAGDVPVRAAHDRNSRVAVAVPGWAMTP